MAIRKQPGFTLIEIILVLAISSFLILIAFVGQHQLQGQARFDASVNKLLQDLAYTRNYAVSNVNEQGGGTKANTTVAGTAFELDNNHYTNPPHQLDELETIYAEYSNGVLVTYDNDPPGVPDASGGEGEAEETFFHLPEDIFVQKLTFTGGSSVDPARGAIFNFIHTPNGVQNCFAVVGPLVIGADAACKASANPDLGKPVDLVLGDSEGRTATIHVDPASGMATRVN